jgi:hypothetical protein
MLAAYNAKGTPTKYAIDVQSKLPKALAHTAIYGRIGPSIYPALC